jgi:Mrp family chromosome partitioning ATPase
VADPGGRERGARNGEANSGSFGALPEPIELSPLVPRDSGGAIGVTSVRFTPRAPYDPRILLWSRQRPSAAAAFRQLRQQLIERSDPRVIVCASASPGEGTSILAANLALAYAELGRPRVLLIETDFRAASMSRLFELRPPIGFGAQLARHRESPDERWLVVQVGKQPFFVLAVEAPGCPKCAAELAEDARFCPRCGVPVGKVATPIVDASDFAAAVQRLRETFDYLVIDAPPVLEDDGVNPVKGAADAVVLAAVRGRSRRSALRHAAARISPTPIAAVALLDE